MVRHWLGDFREIASKCVFITNWNEETKFSSLQCKEMCKWWYWMEDCNITRASPASTDTSSDTTVWHDTILHTLTNLWGPPQLAQGRRHNTSTHQTCKFYWTDRYRCSHSNLQIELNFQHWIRGVWDLSAEEEFLWLVWCLDLSGFGVPALSTRQIGEGRPGPPDRASHQNIIWQLGILEDFFTNCNGSFHSPSSQQSEISKLNK